MRGAKAVGKVKEKNDIEDFFEETSESSDGDDKVSDKKYDHPTPGEETLPRGAWVKYYRSMSGEGGFVKVGVIIEFNGKTVYQRDELFDPHTVDNAGLSNIERMKQGKAPLGKGGKPINLHHIDQIDDGPIQEILQTDHQQNYGNLHSNTWQSPSNINQSQFNTWRNQYWKDR